MAAAQVAFVEHTRHALNRRWIKVAITVDDPNLGGYNLEIPCDRVQRRTQVPGCLDEALKCPQLLAGWLPLPAFLPARVSDPVKAAVEEYDELFRAG